MRFGKYIRVTQCAYERIYYDSEYGQLKDSLPRWEGLKNNKIKLSDSKNLVDNFNNETYVTSNSFLSNNISWTTAEIINGIGYTFKGPNYWPYVRAIEEIFKKCSQGNLYLKNNDQLFCDKDNPDSTSSVLGSFIYEVNKIKNKIIEKYEEMEESLLDLKDYSEFYSEQLNTSINNFDLISQDLKNYKSGHLDEVKHYVKIAKGCGYILVMIYLCILSFISVCGCLFLLAYSYLTNQGNLDILMHIVWNSIKFFSFSFFIYGAMFGMLFNGLRDLINVNIFLFGDNLIAEKTYLLPHEKSKEFLYFCLTEEKAEFTDEMDSLVSENLDELYTNVGTLNNLLNKDYNLKSHFEDTYEIKTSRNRRLELNPDPSDSSIDEFDSDSDSDYSFESDNEDNNTTSLPFETVISMIKEINDSFTDFKKNNNIEETSYNQESLLNSLDCGFLKNDLNILYNSLYDLSVESRILCFLSCFIAFFGEILVNFYLLSMYHYNKTEFREGSLEFTSRRRIREIDRNADSNSQNEFMDKSKPDNMKKFNKKLDLEFSS